MKAGRFVGDASAMWERLTPKRLRCGVYGEVEERRLFWIADLGGGCVLTWLFHSSCRVEREISTALDSYRASSFTTAT